MTIRQILAKADVLPIFDVPTLECAAPLADALFSGGLRVAEITLRTACALDAVKAMKEACPDLIIGVGTIRSSNDIERALNAGADFLVTPGATPMLLEALHRSSAPCLPGVATASEAMIAFEAGFQAMKFFPAEPAGGLAYLKALAGPLPDIAFCPTGAITKDRVGAYLSLPNVVCVGGSWITPKQAVLDKNWAVIEANARFAADISPQNS